MALKYELELLEDLITESLHPKSIVHKRPSKEQISEWMSFVHAECLRIKKTIRSTIHNLENEGRKHDFLQSQQAAITRLADCGIHYLLPKEIEDIYNLTNETTQDNLYRVICFELEKLLKYLEERYRKYFDFDSKVPDILRWKREEDFQKFLVELKRHIRKRKFEKRFAQALKSPFEEMLSIDNEVSYREMYFVEELMNELRNLFGNKETANEEKITSRLLYLNFNSVLFFNHCVMQIADEAGKKKTVSELIDFYSWKIKVVNQTPVKPGNIYLRHLDPIREQIVYWIAEDLYYLDKKHQLSLPMPMPKSMDRDKHKKVHVKLTVADVALGAKLLKDDVVMDMKYSELTERLAKSIRTNRQASISGNYVYNVGFNISAATKEKMKGLLLKLIRKIGEV